MNYTGNKRTHFIQGNCGCRIIHIEGGETELEYCPLHKAAPDMYEACKIGLKVATAMSHITTYASEVDVVIGKAIQQLKQALAKAEGK